MQIIHSLNDLGFKANSIEDLKKQIEDFYSVYGYKPEVKIHEGNIVVVTIDTELFSKGRDLIEMAVRKCNNAAFDEAINLLEEAQKIMPCNGDIYRLKAQIYFMRDMDYDRAMDTCIDALRFNPQDYYSLILMGNILFQGKKDSETAKKYYEKALEYNPNEEIAITNIAAIESQKGNFTSALNYYQRLIDLGRKYPNLYYSLAATYYNMGKMQEAFDTSIEGLKETVDRPENPGVKGLICDVAYKAATELMKKVNTRNVYEGLKEKLEEKLSLPLKVRSNNDMDVYGRMEYGPTRGRDYHVLYYKENAPANALHTIIHEMTHLKMNSEASKQNRNYILFCGEDQYKEFCKDYQPFISKLKSRLGEKAEETIRHIFYSLGLLMMNTPLDLFVEQHIYDTLSTLRPFQFVSLFMQSAEYLKSVISPDVKEFFPDEFIHLVKVCNMVIAMHVNRLYGIDTVAQYKPTDDELAMAKDLYSEYLSYKDFKPGDEYEYMMYFMDLLKVRQYIIIIKEDDFLQNRNRFNERPQVEEKLTKNKEEIDTANAKFAKEHPDKPGSIETALMKHLMVGALEELTSMPLQEVRRVALEIAMIGVNGIFPERFDYRVKTLNRNFGGYELLAYYYVSWAIAFPEQLEVLGLPFSESYKKARQMFEKGKNSNNQ